VTIGGGFLVPFVAMVTAAVLVVLRQRGVPTRRLVVVALFAVYLWGVASQTLFPLELGFVPRPYRSDWAQMNMVPFRGLFDGYQGRMQAVLNVVLGVPLGVLLPLVGVTSAPRVLGLGLLFTFSIEGLQLVENWAYDRQYRTVDANDVMLNWLGVLLGYAVYRIVAARRSPLNDPAGCP
jgi:glycopeptide antibiotics resistance protein